MPPKPPVVKKKALEAAFASLEGGSTVEAACQAADIDRKTFYEWRKGDKELSDRFDIARMGAIGVVEDALLKAALKGNITAQIFFLCNRARDRWQHVNRTEHTGKDGEPITFDLAGLAKKALARMGTPRAVIQATDNGSS